MGKRIALSKLIPAVLILGLAFADFLTMLNMFTMMGLQDNLLIMRKFFLTGNELRISEPIIYSILAALLLEGSPFLLGITFWNMKDHGNYRLNDKLNAKNGFYISLFCLSITLITVVVMRFLIIQKNGGYKAYLGGYYGAVEKISPDDLLKLEADLPTNRQFVAHCFLIVSPVLTSLLALGLSWTFFRNEKAETLRREVDKCHAQFLDAKRQFLDAIYKCDDMKRAMWTALSVSKEMPTDYDIFKKECFFRIRAKLMQNCIIQYQQQIARYNAEIEGELMHYLTEMAGKSTIPADILDIDLEDILKKYDEDQKNANKCADAWSYELAGSDMEEKLTKVINNAVVISQYKTSARPVRVERGY